MYRVDTDEQVQRQIDALPAEALPFFAELRTLLEVDPWGGDPVNDQNPDGPVRTLTFGREHEGLAAYLILDDLRRVDLLQVTWLVFVQYRDERRIDDEVFRRVQRELDLEESMLLRD